MRIIQKGNEIPVRAPIFIIVISLIAAAVVWLAVVKGIGYSLGTGFFYFCGYFAALLLFFRAFGYSLFRERSE